MLYVTHGKGGAGKSTLARYLAHRALERGGVSAFDADASNGSLMRFYPAHTTRIDDPNSPAMAGWFENVVWPAAAAGAAVLDLGSGAERVFCEWAIECGLAEVAKDGGVGLLLAGVLDPSKDALASILATLTAFPDSDHIAVRNAGRLKPGETFDVIEQHPRWADITAKACVLDMPMLSVSMPKIDALNVTFSDAEAGAVKDGAARLSPFDRQRTTNWLRAMDAAWAALP